MRKSKKDDVFEKEARKIAADRINSRTGGTQNLKLFELVQKEWGGV